MTRYGHRCQARSGPEPARVRTSAAIVGIDRDGRIGIERRPYYLSRTVSYKELQVRILTSLNRLACLLTIGSISIAVDAAEAALPPNILAVGAEILAAAAPEELGDYNKASETAAQVHRAMFAVSWQGVETAPKDRTILLGLKRGTEFISAIGYWEVHDEPPFDGGRWTTTVWWGALPTHWAEIPAPPQS